MLLGRPANTIDVMRTWLLTWNSEEWGSLNKAVARTSKGGVWRERWRFHAYRQGRVGDKVYLLKQGKTNRGIVASGIIFGGPFAKGFPAFVEVAFDRVLQPEDGYPRHLLDVPPLNKVNWPARTSGISIADVVVPELERRWSKWLQAISEAKDALAAEDRAHGRGKVYFVPAAEGKPMIREHVVYERSARNRAQAVTVHGTQCMVCGFDFNRFYGADLARD